MDSPQPTPPVAPGSPAPPPSRRSAQVALAVFLAVMIGLLAFRGYGGRLTARPTDPDPPPKVDLNAADHTQLEQVPGIGPKLARAIEDHRREKGPFKSLDELRGVHGVGPATVEKVRPFVRVEAEDGPPPDPEPLRLERKPAAPRPAAPSPRPGGAVRKIQPGDPPIDVNAASAQELQRLPGVGPVTARKIVDARAAAPFKSADDLRRVKGIGLKTLEGLRPYVVVK